MRWIVMLLAVRVFCFGQYLVSARTLAHRVPDRAVKEYRRSLEDIRTGDCRDAVERLRVVLSIDDEFPEAHNAMGYCQLHHDQLQDALASFERAAELEPGLAVVQVNAAVALMVMGRYPEAEKAARRGMSLDPLSIEAPYAVGECLLRQGKYTEEALDCFRRSEDRYPRARLLAGYVHYQRGNLGRAAASMRHYLATANPPNRTALEVWVRNAERQRQASDSVD